jgi:FSR family fosmidomycin resistance protein-like MFS transporter
MSPVYRTLLFVCAGHFLVDFMLGIFPAYKTLLGIDLTEAGLIVAVSAALGEAFQFISGPLTDRGYGGRMVLLGVFLSAGMGLLGYTTNPLACFFLVQLTYIGSAFFHPAAGALTIVLCDKRRSFFLGIFAASGALGLSLGQTVFYYVYETFYGHTLILALPALLLVCLNSSRTAQDLNLAKSRTPFKFRDIVTLMSNRHFQYLYVSAVGVSIAVWSTVFLLPDLLSSQLCPDWVTFGGGHAAFMLGGAILTIFFGRLGDHFGPRPISLCTLSVSIAAFFLLLSLYQAESSTTLMLLFLAGGTLTSYTALALSLGNQLVAGQPGLVSTCLMGMAWIVAEGIGPLAAGFLATYLGPAGSLACTYSAVLLSIFCLTRIPSATKPQEVSIRTAPLAVE